MHLLILGFIVSWVSILPSVVNSQVVPATAASYAPTLSACPTEIPLLRLAGSPATSNQTLCNEEASYQRGRKTLIAPLWEKFYTSGPGNQTGYASLFKDDSFQLPMLALAHSGGGFRASLYGAGVVQAFDARTENSPVAGVFQLAMIQSGLSGGSWLVGGLAMNGYPQTKELVSSWLLNHELFVPSRGNIISDARYLDALMDDVEEKRKAGYQVSLTDPWARALSYHFMPGTTESNFYDSSAPTAHGAGILFSALKDTSDFKGFQHPFPIIVSDHQPPAGSPAPEPGNIVPLATTVFETTPFEFGSFDPYLSAFTPTQFLGTYLDAGRPYLPISVRQQSSSKGSCTTGFDQAGFVIGTSSSLFNAVVGTAVGSIVGQLLTSQLGFVKVLAQRLANKSDLTDIDTAHYPNPFKGVNGPAGFDQTNSVTLEMVDGGENGENLPINCLLAPARAVDVILAADGSADTDASSPIGAYWPNGTALIATYKRVTNVLPKGSASFPPIPMSPQEWMAKGYSTRPTFFGCNAPERTGNGGYPLVVYLPNSPFPEVSTGFFTNTSTFKLQYSKAEASSFLESATLVTTSPVIAGSTDKNWSTCLSCAMMDRARNRLPNKFARSDICRTCFEKYCYPDGVPYSYTP